MDGLGRIGEAIVGVTAYDTTNTCEVNSWSPSGGDLDAFVGCDNFDGDPTATLFDLVVTRPTSPPHGVSDCSFVMTPPRRERSRPTSTTLPIRKTRSSSWVR